MHLLQKQKAICEEADLYHPYWDSQQQRPAGLQCSCFTSSASECTDAAVLHMKPVSSLSTGNSGTTAHNCGGQVYPMYPTCGSGGVGRSVLPLRTKTVWTITELNPYNSFTWMFWEDCRAIQTLKYTTLCMILAISYSLPCNKLFGAMSPAKSHGITQLSPPRWAQRWATPLPSLSTVFSMTREIKMDNEFHWNLLKLAWNHRGKKSQQLASCRWCPPFKSKVPLEKHSFGLGGRWYTPSLP